MDEYYENSIPKTPKESIEIQESAKKMRNGSACNTGGSRTKPKMAASKKETPSTVQA